MDSKAIGRLSIMLGVDSNNVVGLTLPTIIDQRHTYKIADSKADVCSS